MSILDHCLWSVDESCCVLFGLQVCQLAAAAEAASEHPLARAVLEFAEAQLSTAPSASKTAVALAGSPGSAGATNGLKHSSNASPVVAMYSLDDDHSSGGSTSSHGSAFAAAQAYEQQRQTSGNHSNSSSRGSLSGDGSTGWPQYHSGFGSRRAKQQHSAGALVYGTQGRGLWVGKGSAATISDSGGCISPVETPVRLKRILSSGALKVSDVQVGPALEQHAPASNRQDDHCLGDCLYLVVNAISAHFALVAASRVELSCPCEQTKCHPTQPCTGGTNRHRADCRRFKPTQGR